MALVDPAKCRLWWGPNFVAMEWKNIVHSSESGRPWSEHEALCNLCAMVETLTLSLKAVEFEKGFQAGLQ